MNHPAAPPAFGQPDLQDLLCADPEAADVAPFGVIGFDAEEIVRVYNRHESAEARLSPERVLGQSIFSYVAPCMDNALVAQRFRDAARQSLSLDVVIDFVLTFRMAPTKVRMRLLYRPDLPLRFVLIARR